MNRDDIIALVQRSELLMSDGWGNMTSVRPTGRFTEDSEIPTRPRYFVEVQTGWFSGKKWVPVSLLKAIQEARK